MPSSPRSPFESTLRVRNGVESNTPFGDDPVTNARTFALTAAVNRLKQKAKGCPADRIPSTYNIVGLSGVKIELQGRGNAQNQ